MNLFGLGFKPIHDDNQHAFAQVTDETDGSVLPAEPNGKFILIGIPISKHIRIFPIFEETMCI